MMRIVRIVNLSKSLLVEGAKDHPLGHVTKWKPVGLLVFALDRWAPRLVNRSVQFIRHRVCTGRAAVPERALRRTGILASV